MNYGKLRCLGTQTRLKARFGSGYQLQFHCAPGRVEQVESFVQSHLPRAIHMETYAGIHIGIGITLGLVGHCTAQSQLALRLIKSGYEQPQCSAIDRASRLWEGGGGGTTCF